MIKCSEYQYLRSIRPRRDAAGVTIAASALRPLTNRSASSDGANAITFKLLTLLTILTVGQLNMFAASAPLELKWSELNAVIFQKTVELRLPNMVKVKGEIAAVREDSLVLYVNKTSNSKTIPKGNLVIPRTSVTLLKLEQPGTNWRAMGTVLGVISGVTLGGYIAGKTASSPGAGIAIFLATATAVSVAGRGAGGSADRITRMIRVVD